MIGNFRKLLTCKGFSNFGIPFTWIDGSKHTTSYISSINLGNVGVQNKYGQKEVRTFMITPYAGNGVNGVPTPVDYDDYDLNSVVDDLTFVSMTSIPATATSVDSHITHTYIAIAENQTDAPITICEFGLFIPCMATQEWTPSQQLMIHREVFEPVTIQPGEAFTFTINFK